MKKLYIHIGTGKTGTTAIQKFIDTNSELLEVKYNIKYSTTHKIDSAHHELCSNFTRDVDFVIEEIMKKRLQLLIAEAKDSTCNTFIISSENFPGVTEQEIKNIYIDTLKHYFDVHVIVYVRRQDEYIESWFAQLIKTERYNANIKNLIVDLNKAGLLDYYLMINKWSTHISKENIHLKVYEKSQFYKGNIFNDFMQLFGIEDLQYFTLLENDPNASLSRDQVILIKAFYNSGLERFMDDVIKKPFDFKPVNSRYFLSPAERTQIVLDCSSTNEAVAREYLNRSDGKLFYAPLPIENGENWVEVTQPSTEYLLRTFTHLLSKQKIHFENEIKELKQTIERIQPKI